MPPANSRATSTPADPTLRSETPPSYLSALRELESPVSSSILNIAATLTTPAEDDVESENLRFLRSRDPQDEWRAENARERLRWSTEREEGRERRERLQRVINRLSRLHDTPAYGDRIPSTNNLYDWSPSNEDDDNEQLNRVLQELRQQQPGAHPEIVRVMGRAQLDAARERDRDRDRERGQTYTSRTAASRYHTNNSPADTLLRPTISQSVRRHPRFSTRSRDYMSRYIADRETYRTMHDGEPPQDRSSSRPYPTSSRYEANRQAWQAQQRSSLDSSFGYDQHVEDASSLRAQAGFRRAFLDDPTTSGTEPAIPPLERAIKYLAEIRSSNSLAGSLDSAADAGFVSKEFFGGDHDDFILDPDSIPSPVKSSWLAPGRVLSGFQHATASSANITRHAQTNTTVYRLRGNDSISSTTYGLGDRTSSLWTARGWIPPHARRAGDSLVTQTPGPHQGQWPVRVAIHAVDWESMTMSATMEAYNVPSSSAFLRSSGSQRSAHNNHDHTSAPHLRHFTSSHHAPHIRTSSITTYLEGEILDFKTHTLLTENFNAKLSEDARYWRKLPPFNGCATDEELVRCLVSTEFMWNLNQEWILMRWKERCFVKNIGRHDGGRHPISDGDRGFSTSGLSSSWGNQPRWAEGEWSRTPDDAAEREFAEEGCGLTISGFYYVSLRRSDGKVEALYCDPQSSPYQHLVLSPVDGGRFFPGWEFR